MDKSTAVAVAPPSWIQEGLEGHFEKQEHCRRGKPRQMWVRLATLKATVRIANVTANGVGLISREPFTEGQCIRVTPEGATDDGGDYEPATLRVVHCTSGVNGYKIGCVFV